MEKLNPQPTAAASDESQSDSGIFSAPQGVEEAAPLEPGKRVEFVVREGRQGVFSSHSLIAAQMYMASTIAEAHRQGVERKLSLWERTCSYDAIDEQHPQHPAQLAENPDTEKPKKLPGDVGVIPSGEHSFRHPGTVKERKLA